MLVRFIFFVSIVAIANTISSQDKEVVKVFEPGIVSLPEVKEGSPSVTADGKTMVFARYQNYGKKAPHIAFKEKGGWKVEALSFTDTLYNLTISPDGNTIFYKERLEIGNDVEYHTYIVRKNRDGEWNKPTELIGTLIQNAGYFRVAKDGTLYMYINNAAGNPKGIYYAGPTAYDQPMWLSDAISIYGATVYTPIPNADETMLIVNRAGLGDGDFAKKYGPAGLRIHKKSTVNGIWAKRSTAFHTHGMLPQRPTIN